MPHHYEAPSASQVPPLVSVNWHMWAWCNYECTFCFARFRDVSRALDVPRARRILDALAAAGTEKLTIAGGEPTLCPWLDEALAYAKQLGMTTMIVTNGTGVTREFLEKTKGTLDYVTLSIDSANDATEAALGRGTGNHVANARQVAKLVAEFGIPLKVNTVVTSINHGDDMHDLIRDLAPVRWKVFQMLPIEGENDEATPLQVADEDFVAYIRRHADLSPVAEDNDAMTDSYIMLDPIGRFFQNTSGTYVRSRSILEVSVAEALRDVAITPETLEKLGARGGIWNWERS